MHSMQSYVYILASKAHGTLYVGASSDLKNRIRKHKNESLEGFTKKYEVATLVYYEPVATMIEALAREKQLKRWKRGWKIASIEKINPNWKDLSDEI